MKKLLLIIFTAIIVMGCEKSEIQKESSQYEIIAYCPVHFNYYTFVYNNNVKDENKSEVTKILSQRVHRYEKYKQGASVQVGLISLGTGGAFVKLEVKKDGITIYKDSTNHQLTYGFIAE